MLLLFGDARPSFISAIASGSPTINHIYFNRDSCLNLRFFTSDAWNYSKIRYIPYTDGTERM